MAQSGTDWQSSAGETARRIWITTLAAVAAVLLALLGYASWLSWRIRRLSRAAETALDSSGRLRSDFPRARLDDEIGSLNDAFAQLLGELDQHHQYLRTLASKLSHELRTPLAIVRSSLDNLESTDLPASARDYARRASEGSQRLSGILNALSGAQQLEAGIASAEREDFDLGDLLDVLASSYADSQPRHHIAMQRPAGPLPAHGAPELVAQLLDKLIDNACSFAPAGTTIELSAERVAGHYRIAVSNPGPPLPEGFGQQIFDSLVSIRPEAPGRLHLGLGLHIARLICEFHGGRLEARNRPDGSGAIFAFLLPA
ncbi:ATP-binding protein [Biformimicrobium ophioploci]|uniref:ATP-binding protein n=1 Tax=Biformimicrobium ophioploci TaxID=3036711 RepID=UPI003DA05752